MRTGLPRFSALSVIELSIRGPLIEWGYSIAYLLAHFGNIDYYLVHRFQDNYQSLKEQAQAPLIHSNLKGLYLDNQVLFRSFEKF